jgi:hypothetical protein
VGAEVEPISPTEAKPSSPMIYAYKIDYVNYERWITVENPNLTVNTFPNAMVQLGLSKTGEK